MFSFDGNVRKDTLRSLCARFINLYYLIFVPFGPYASKNNENVEYMNYWLNKELKNEGKLNISATEFYEELIFNNSLFDTNKRLKDKIHKINDEDLEKMNTLYHLNAIFHNIKVTSYGDKTKCSSYSDQCVQKFKDAIKSCSADNNDKYCEALKSFKNKYEQLDENNNFRWCKKEYLSTLPPLGEKNEQRLSETGPAADKSELEEHPKEEKNQDFGAQDDIQKEEEEEEEEVEGDDTINTIQQSLSSAGENNNDNNINIYTIFGIILSISVFSTITYKVIYITYKNNNI
ncbi:hypothetical protein PVBG_05773 [Plasmodium vivax Brazil I]|uniref:Uncharacterized protein n=1 Tax=Plasmodium vivax (strain Brazil I) TaxID=1033975 RepID=A0A0J9VAP4_PLAV1|nr:hypothetical protein PVBG_05773 [Plasmodium vivax Brazil I]